MTKILEWIGYMVFAIFLIVAGGLLAAILQGCSKCPSVDWYVMPDGARCRYRWVERGKTEFNGCENRKTYINPESYSQIPECK